MEAPSKMSCVSQRVSFMLSVINESQIQKLNTAKIILFHALCVFAGLSAAQLYLTI